MSYYEPSYSELHLRQLAVPHLAVHKNSLVWTWTLAQQRHAGPTPRVPLPDPCVGFCTRNHPSNTC